MNRRVDVEPGAGEVEIAHDAEPKRLVLAILQTGQHAFDVTERVVREPGDAHRLREGAALALVEATW